MSWRSASTSTSSPASRAASLVTGPIETTRAPAGKRAAERLGQVADGRGRGEGDVVGALRRLDRLRLGLLADRLIEGDGVDLGAALAQRVGKDVAGLGGAGDEDPAALDLDLGERLDQRLGDEALGHDVGVDAVLGERLARCPGPIAATVAPASARASRPGRRQRLEQQPRAVGLVTQTSEYSPIASTAARTSSLSIRGSIRIAGSSTASAPSAAQGRGEAAGLGAGAGDDDPAAVQRPPLEPGERLAARRRPAPTTISAGAPTPSRSTAAASVAQRRGDRALPVHRPALDRGGRLVRRRGRRRSAPRRCRRAA